MWRLEGHWNVTCSEGTLSGFLKHSILVMEAHWEKPLEKKLVEEYREEGYSGSRKGYADPGKGREDTMTLLTKSWKEN